MMTAGPITTGPDLLAYDALQLMENRTSQISVLPVVDENSKAIGLLRLHDIVRAAQPGKYQSSREVFYAQSIANHWPADHTPFRIGCLGPAHVRDHNYLQ
jgi:CBS-domain-containing membrane protein